MALGGAAFLGRLPRAARDRCRARGESFRLEALVTPHEPRDDRYDAPGRRGMAMLMDREGGVQPLRASRCRSLPPE